MADIAMILVDAIVVALIVGILVSGLGWTRPEGARSKDQAGPLLALLVGVVLAGGIALSTGSPPVLAVLSGLLAGLAAMGIHDLVDLAVG